MKKQIGDLTLIKLLGKGSYGEVYLSKKQNSNKLFATKRVNETFADKEMERYLKYEINILKKLYHENIVRFEEEKTDENYHYIVMEYINGGELSDYLKKYKSIHNKGFPEEVVQYLMRQIVDAVKYIHERGIIHRDLKLENIMVNFDSEKDKQELNMMKAKIKIIDFGFAIHLPSQCSTTFSAVGTFLYMDPKILEKFNQKAMQDKKRGYGKEVDIWSLGCICYGLYRGKYPFQANNFAELIDKINYGKYSLPKTASKEIYSFLDKMLQYDGKARLSAEELISHPFLTTNPKNFTHIEIGENTKEIKEKKSNIPLYKYEGSNSQKNNTYPEHHIKVANNLDKSKNLTYNNQFLPPSVPSNLKPNSQSQSFQKVTNRPPSTPQPPLHSLSVPIQQPIQMPFQTPMQIPVQQNYQLPLQQSYQQTYHVSINSNFQPPLQQSFQPQGYIGGISPFGVVQSQSQFIPQRSNFNIDNNVYL